MTDLIMLEDHEQGIVSLTLNRPEKCNAFDDKFIAVFIDLLKQVAADDNVHVLLLKANGKHFSAGADLAWMQRMVNYTEKENLEDSLQLAKLMQTLYRFPKPTVALAQGKTFGGGVGLLACCDVVFAAADAQFCFSEVKLGLTPAVISPYVIAAIGERATRKVFLSAEVITADYAKTLGLVTELVEPNHLLEHGLHYAKKILQNSPAALMACKALSYSVSDKVIDDTLILSTAKQIAKIRVTEDAQHRLQAFLATKNKGASTQ